MEKIPDTLWNVIKKYIPKKTSKRGRPEMDARKALNGIFYVIRSGCQWKNLPKEYGCKSTIHGKFMAWTRSGLFDRIMNTVAIMYLASQNELPNWFAIDANHSKAPFASWGGNSPVDRRKNGVKKIIAVDRKGAPLSLAVGAGNTHDSKFFTRVLINLKKLTLPNLNIIAADAAFDSKKLRDFSKNLSENSFNTIKLDNCSNL